MTDSEKGVAGGVFMAGLAYYVDHAPLWATVLTFFVCTTLGVAIEILKHLKELDRAKFR